jgi:hypothetical protein
MVQSPDEAHYRLIAQRILDGAVVPFLGAGVNLCGRPAGVPWQRGRYLPSGAELATYLAIENGFPQDDDRTNLLRVSQYVEVMLGLRPLYKDLHYVFDADYDPTPVHRLLATLPSLVRGSPSAQPKSFPLIVTTNYDDALENAFKNVDEEYDLVSYIADAPAPGRFLHTNPGGTRRIIRRPNSYTELNFDERPVIVKIHGTVNRGKRDGDSFVISENQYIDYLSRTDIAQLIPVRIAERLRQTHFLFLGYSLRDWNLRVILHRIFRDDQWGWNSWAVQLRPNNIEERSWFRQGVELLDIHLEEYIARLSEALETPVSATTSEMP